LNAFVERARAVTQKPLAVGFGIATPDQARQVAEWADGVIVGSALIDAVRKSEKPVESAAHFVFAMHQAFASSSAEPL
jgi:tryptophan synthase alpha chain